MCNLFIIICSCIIITTAQISNFRQEHRNFHLLPQPPACSNPYGTNRIVGGKFAAMGQFPWMARLGYVLQNCPALLDKPIFSCAGSLIASKFVLTAAHCLSFQNQPKCFSTGNYETALLTVVKLGEYDIKTETDCQNNICASEPQMISIERFVGHENFNSSTLYNDIAIIELKTKADINEWVSPICLPFSDIFTKNYVNSKASVAGWGIMTNSPDTRTARPDILKYILLPIQEVSECAKYFTMLVEDGSQLCVGGEEGHDSCTGDSGGPLMIVDVALDMPREYQIGIVSYGYILCGSKDVPAVYTDVRFYIDWILDHLD